MLNVFIHECIYECILSIADKIAYIKFYGTREHKAK